MYLEYLHRLPSAESTHVVPEIKAIRLSTESKLQCGVPNMEYANKQEEDVTLRQRRKRLVGGEEALPVSHGTHRNTRAGQCDDVY